MSAPTIEMLDLDQYEDVPTSTVVIKNPATGAPTAMAVDVFGPEHPERKKIVMNRVRKLRADFQRNGKIVATDPLEDVDLETEFLVACTAGWTGVVRAGVAVEFTPAAAQALYTDPKLQWLRAQIKKALDESERFISSSVKA